jgi:hypothetical protein
MAAPVTDLGSVECKHQGAVLLSPVSDRRLTAGGGKVVLAAEVLEKPYVNCGAPTPPGTCVSTVPSPTPSPTASGRPGLLTVGGAAVLLDSLQATSLPAGTPVTVVAGQSVLTVS